MEISDVRVKLIENANDRLRAVCSVTFDGAFVVRDVKVVDGTNGLFVAMPSRKLSVHCPQCRQKNHLRAKYCNECGAKLPANKLATDANGRVRLHRDIAHPLNPAFREMVQSRVIQCFQTEFDASQQPGYRPVEVEEEEGHPVEPMVEPIVEPTEPSEPDELIEVNEEMTEYDALIAGLRGGSGETRPSPAPSRSGGGNRTPPPSAPRQPAPRREEHDSRRRDARPVPEPRRDRPQAPPAPRPARAPAPVAETRRREPSGFDDAPAPQPRYSNTRDVKDESPPPPRPSQPRETPRPEPPPPPPKKETRATDEDAPFGQGIL